MLKTLSRHQIDSSSWDACVNASSQQILYGYSWYLDAVLPSPNWKWIGVVVIDINGQYQAVMPIPLRRKLYRWVVHQPFFCQFLGIFNRNESLNFTPFFQLLRQEFSYGSTLSMRQSPADLQSFNTLQKQTTLILDLSVKYELLSQNYTRDRVLNLRRAHAANWTIIDSSDPEPLLALFRDNHADFIDGGVANWAYDIFRTLLIELNKRGLAVLRYASHNDQIEAGALFIQDESRIIYLFNAASKVGRLGNARTMLIDQIIREYAGYSLLLDFESPGKLSIRDYYRSFGAVEDPFWTIRWNRLNLIENVMRNVVNVLRSK